MSKKSSMPGVLVVVATLGKRPDYLALTLQSVRNQDYPNIDIVLVYPSKSIVTKKLAQKYNASSLEDPGSMSNAVNIGIRSAKSKHAYVTWIGDDDLLEPGMVRLSVEALENNPKASASFGHCRYINEDGKLIFTSKAGRLAPFIMTWGPNLVPLPGSMFRVAGLKRLDYIFDTSLHYAMDLDLFLRLQKLGPLVSVKAPVASFRWHSTSTTVANREASMQEAEMVKRRYLGMSARRVSFLWELPVRTATRIAAQRVAKLSK
jgi:glycosyltransferase involved in cell wall biosynthesis